MTKKHKENRRVPAEAPEKSSGGQGNMGTGRIFSYLKIPLLLLVFSVGAVFVYDFVVQSPLFMIREIKVSGNDRVTQEEILALCGLDKTENIFRLNVPAVEKKLSAHPWIESASVKRESFSGILIRITEQRALAVANIENIIRVVINTQGIPFKEYEPERDHLGGVPVISGLDLTLSGSSYEFQGPLFQSIMEFLNTNPQAAQDVITVNGDSQTGILIYTRGVFDTKSQSPGHMIPIRLGFDHFAEKLEWAKKIGAYMAKNFPEKTIRAMDLFDMEKVFIKVQDGYGQLNDMGRGV